MSRIGNKAITIPAGVEITIAEGNEVTVKGPKGTLTKKFSPLMDIAVEDGVLTVKRPNEEKQTKQLHGTTRALLNAMIEGVDKTFTKQLKIVGIGYRAALAGNKLTLNVGFSHPVEFTVPSDVKVEVPDATTINVSGIDKPRSLNLMEERESCTRMNMSAVRKVRPQRPRSNGKERVK